MEVPGTASGADAAAGTSAAARAAGVADVRRRPGVALWWRAFPRNARILTATEPAWSVFGAYWGVYMPLYFTSLGAGAGLIGWISAWSYGLQAVCSLLGGQLARRMRRIQIVTLFDFVSWIVPFILWLALPALWVAVAAQLLTVVSMLVVPAWNALFLEDAAPRQRAPLLNLFNLAIYAPAIVLPVLARLIHRDGLVPVTHWVFTYTLVAIGAAWLIRALTVRDSSLADTIRAHHAEAPPWEEYRPLVTALLRPTALLVLAIGFCATARAILWSTYLPLLLVNSNGLHLHGASIVLLPAVGALAVLVTGVLAMPHLNRDHPVGALVLGQLGALASSLLIALAPAGHWWAVVLAWLLGAAAAAIIFPTQAAIWYNLFPREHYTALQAVTGSVGTLIAIPVGPLAGVLFTLAPRLPFWANVALQTIGLVLTLALLLRPPSPVAADGAPTTVSPSV